jgi:GNAT superfamily N-acetyltransferase
MDEIAVALLNEADVEWLEGEFNSRWPWPRRGGFVAAQYASCPHFVARDTGGRYLGHCLVRASQHPPFVERGVREIADLNVMPESRRRGVATAILVAAEAHVAVTAREVGIGVGLYDAYGAAQRLYAAHGYVPDGTGLWVGTKPVEAGDVVTVNDDLILYLTKRLQ